jgi:hypothetical protein
LAVLHWYVLLWRAVQAVQAAQIVSGLVRPFPWLQVTEVQQSLPSHELASEALKDLGSLHTGIHTNVRFRRNKAKVGGAGCTLSDSTQAAP